MSDRGSDPTSSEGSDTVSGVGMTLTRHLPATTMPEEVVAAVNQVQDQLAAQADADDDPTTRRGDVRVVVEPHPSGGLAVRGFLDASPVAPYLDPAHDPFEGVPRALLAQIRDDPAPTPTTTPPVGPQGPDTAPRAFSGPITPESASTTGGDE